MAAKKQPAAPKKASGRNISEDERNTERVTVRLDPEAMETLRHYAAAWRCPMSEVVTCALDSLRGDKAINDAMVLAAPILASPDRSKAT